MVINMLHRNGRGMNTLQMIRILFYFYLLFAGESPIDFLFDFLEVSQGPFGGFDVVDNRPRAGKGNKTCDLPK